MEIMNFKEYRTQRLKEIEGKTDRPATYADETTIEQEWEKRKEWEEDQDKEEED